MDSHAKRTLPVHLGIATEATANVQSAIARNWTHLQANVPRSSLTIDDIYKVYDENKPAIEWVADNAKLKFNRAGFSTAVAMRMKATNPKPLRSFSRG